MPKMVRERFHSFAANGKDLNRGESVRSFSMHEEAGPS